MRPLKQALIQSGWGPSDKRGQDTVAPRAREHRRGPWEDVGVGIHLPAREKGFGRNHSCWHLDQ